MKIRVRDISSGGIDIEGSLAKDQLGEIDEGFNFPNGVNIVGRVQRTNDAVYAQVDVKGKYESFCFRCLAPVENVWKKSLALDFKIDKVTEYVDISDDIRQELAVALPSRILCKEDCLGICAGCGMDLNHEKCKCDKQGK